MLPSHSVRVTRLESCSQVMSRPCRSRVWPLALLEGLRKIETVPVSSSHFRMRLFGMSLHSRKRPSPNHTGPSDQRHPVYRRSTDASASRYLANSGCSTRTFGSGYRSLASHMASASLVEPDFGPGSDPEGRVGEAATLLV